MSVKNAKTINEYKILKWVEENFVPGSVNVKFLSENRAKITDKNNDAMTVTITDGNIVFE